MYLQSAIYLLQYAKLAANFFQCLQCAHCTAAIEAATALFNSFHEEIGGGEEEEKEEEEGSEAGKKKGDGEEEEEETFIVSWPKSRHFFACNVSSYIPVSYTHLTLPTKA